MQKSRDYILKKRLILAVVWLGIVVVSLFYAYDYSIGNLNFQPSQPVPFSHKTHIEKLGMKCTFCHYDATTNKHANIPSIHTCMTCHIAFRNEVDAMKPLNLSSDNDSVLIWKRIYKLPDYVHFSHKNHVNRQMDCSSCHNEVELLDSNKLTTRMTMKWCLDCHRNPESKIVPPREVSGIFMTNDKINFQSGKPMTQPYFGKMINKIKEKEGCIRLPNDPGKGPENCSACHH